MTKPENCMECLKVLNPQAYAEAVREAEAEKASSLSEDQNWTWEFSAVEQGYYDDDPNPYHGDYSEM